LSGAPVIGPRSKSQKQKPPRHKKSKPKPATQTGRKASFQSSSVRSFQEGFAGGAPAPQNFAGGKGMGVSSYPQ
jgi:hypothetical protein